MKRLPNSPTRPLKPAAQLDPLILRAQRGDVQPYGATREEALANLRILCHDAVEVLASSIADDSFDSILIFFPDPWHKKRHHKRRLIDAPFLGTLAAKLKAGGVLRLATDWQAYAEQMLSAGNACEQLESLSADRTYVERPDFRPATRFERRGARLGHGVWDLAYIKAK